MSDVCNRWPKVLKFETICRICLSEGEMKSLFSQENPCEKSICDMLRILTSTEFVENKYFPMQICVKCVVELEQICRFVKQCKDAENILRNYKKSHDEIRCNLTCNNSTEDNIEVKTVKEEEESNLDFNDYTQNTESENHVKISVDAEKIIDIDIEISKPGCEKLDCELCDLVFSSKKDFLQHRKNAHPRKRFYSCGICSKLIPGGRRKAHMKQHNKPSKLHRCQICKRQFNNSYNLKRHEITHSGIRPFQCEHCNKSFTRLDYLNTHRSLHCGGISCSFCAKTFTNYEHFQSHLNLHDTKNNLCELCQEEFSSAESLLKHLESHQTERSLFCKLCGKTFSTVRQFKIHMKKHFDNPGTETDPEKVPGEKIEDKTYRHVCSVCSRAFQSRTSLNNHLLIHGEKKFLCSDCGKRFISLAQLQSHMRMHSGSKPFKCKLCGKCFAQRSGLNTHNLIHSGQKPYVCTVCGKSFTQSHHRKRHMMVHSGERPFSCSVCGKNFSQKENFVVHMRVHTGETPYGCSLCSKRFYDSSSLNKHKKSHSK